MKEDDPFYKPVKLMEEQSTYIKDMLEDLMELIRHREIKKDNIENYEFHHIDISKCRNCKNFWCESACFRGIYEVINKTTEPKCTVVKDRETMCVKCHICTTACKFGAIIID